MSFENIQLPPFLIQDLYRDHLIDDNNIKSGFDILKNEQIQYLGKNEKKILVIVKEENVPFLQDNDLNFLIGILHACKLSMADIALVNIKNGLHKNKAFMAQFNPEKYFLFGVAPSEMELPLLFPHFQVQQYSNIIYLSGPSLNQIAADKVLKQLLWDSLKKVFVI